MNKTSKTVLKTVLITALSVIIVAVLLLALIGFGITAFVGWVWGGMRFSPEAAIEAVGLHSSEKPRIEAGDCYFYYDTFEGYDRFQASEDKSDWIAYVTPVMKNEFGLWYARPKPHTNTVYIDGTEEDVGYIIPVEADGVYHNFFIPNLYGTDTLTLHDCLSDGYSCVVVEGQEIELFKHSYFVTENAVESFEINGTKFTVSN